MFLGECAPIWFLVEVVVIEGGFRLSGTATILPKSKLTWLFASHLAAPQLLYSISSERSSIWSLLSHRRQGKSEVIVRGAISLRLARMEEGDGPRNRHTGACRHMGDGSVPKRQELEGRQVKVGLLDQVQGGREH